jgi:hypothetical protein
VSILFTYLHDRSAIVKTYTLQALTALAKQDVNLQPQVIRTLEAAVVCGSPAMQNKARKLLVDLKRRSPY